MTLAEIHAELVAAILVLRDRDGLPVTAEHARERANNIMQWLLGATIHEDPEPRLGPQPSDLVGHDPIVAATRQALKLFTPPREIAAVRNVRCDGAGCGRMISSDGVAVQVSVAVSPQRTILFYHRRCKP